jgi:phasin family protein
MVTPATAAPAATKPANANRATKTRKPVATKPAVTKPAKTKPVVSKSIVSKPAVTKPAAPVLRSVPVTETAPITGTDPARPRPVLKSVPTPLTPYFQESLMATAFETNPEKIAETLKASVAQLNTSAEAAMTSGKAAMEQITAKSKEAVESSMKSLDEMTDMARGNVEAMLASAKTVQSGIEAMVAHVSEVTKKSFEEASAIAKSMASAKTPNEMMQLQTDFAKAQYDSAVAEFSKMTEMMVKLSGEAMEPMQNRIALATDKMKTLFNK